MIDVQEIADLYEERRKAQGPQLRRMRELTDAYNGDLVVPLPQMDLNERSFIANQVQSGVDQMSSRAASVMPNVMCPADKPGEPRSEAYAHIRRQAIYGGWEASQVGIKMRRRAKHLMAYACSPVILRPDFKRELPTWHLASPLHTYPAPTENPDDMLPSDTIVACQRSWGWLSRRHPDKVGKLRAGKPSVDDQFDVLEYIDENEMVLCVVGKAPPREQGMWGSQEPMAAAAPIVELARIPNRIGRPTIVVPGRVTLDRRQGKFDGMVGMYIHLAKMMALESIAVERGIFPETWLIARQGELPKVIVPADAKQGVVGVVQGGEIMQPANNPGYKTQQTIDRLSSEMRQEGGIPSDFNGSTGAEVRTQRRGAGLIDAATSFPIQETQAIFEQSLSTENEIFLSMSKAYFGDIPKSFFVNWSKAKGQVDYTPNKHFTSTKNFVNYAYPGSDAESLPVVMGQRVGLGELSLQTMREIDPLVDDPIREHERVLFEALEKSVLGELGQPGTMTLPDKARVAQMVIEDKETFFNAVLKVQKEAQTRQATSGAPGTPEGPMPPGSPEAQPGIAPPGAGAEAGTVPPPPQGATNVESILAALHGAPGARVAA